MTRARNVWAMALTAVVLAGAAVWSGAASAAPSADPTPTSDISVVQTPSGADGLCLPDFLSLQNTTSSTATTFTLNIFVTAPLCQRLNVIAAIYRMPGDGVAWPQTLVQTKGFSLKEPGVTTVTFTKGCEPAQFDVVTGATPPEIAPWGAWHGPLLFPTDTSTAEQFWGCGPPPTTTTTTSTTSTTSTTIANDCDAYIPGDVTASPTTVEPGQAINVSGTGVAGTAIQVVLRPSGSNGVDALSDPALVGPDGKWSTVVYVPPTATPGSWVVAAQAVDCETEVTTLVQVVAAGTTPTTTPPTTAEAQVAGEVVVRDLANEAVQTSSGTQDGDDPQVLAATAAKPDTSGLAFTGSSSRLAVTIAVALIAVGGLLVLRQRRRRA
ncbi:hypothetical protein BH10ACT3_BH10ACT3_15280 [soil metagenome]